MFFLSLYCDFIICPDSVFVNTFFAQEKRGKHKKVKWKRKKKLNKEVWSIGRSELSGRIDWKHDPSVSPWVTISIGGVTLLPKMGDDYDDYLKIADNMLYKAKPPSRMASRHFKLLSSS